MCGKAARACVAGGGAIMRVAIRRRASTAPAAHATGWAQLVQALCCAARHNLLGIKTTTVAAPAAVAAAAARRGGTLLRAGAWAVAWWPPDCLRRDLAALDREHFGADEDAAAGEDAAARDGDGGRAQDHRVTELLVGRRAIQLEGAHRCGGGLHLAVHGDCLGQDHQTVRGDVAQRLDLRRGEGERSRGCCGRDEQRAGRPT